jgi:MFS family permease
VNTQAVRLGLRANAGQFALLVALNAFVGAMVGLERSVLPLVGEDDFGLVSKTAILSFVIAFGIAKALANLAAGDLAERVGRKRLLVLGWLVALPVPFLIAFAPNWWVIVLANGFLGVNQGLAWSMTVVMKIDLVGPARRGLALGLNESSGYLGVAVTALATGALAAIFAPRTIVWAGAAAIAVLGTLVSVLFVRDTGAHVGEEQRAHGAATVGRLRDALARGTLRDPVLRACSQAGLVNNLNDALAWGLAPLYLAANGASITEVGIVAGVYPAVWGAGQLATGWLSDYAGRKPLIVAGMVVQAVALGTLVAGAGPRCRDPARRRHRACVPDAHRRRLGRRSARRASAAPRRLPLLAGLRLRRRGGRCRGRGRRIRGGHGHRRGCGSHRGKRSVGGGRPLRSTTATATANGCRASYGRSAAHRSAARAGSSARGDASGRCNRGLALER